MTDLSSPGPDSEEPRDDSGDAEEVVETSPVELDEREIRARAEEDDDSTDSLL